MQLAGMMWSLASQQRRLLAGQKHVSFSRDSEGLFRGHAATSDSGCRRQKKLTASELQHHQQQFQQTAGCLRSGIHPIGSNSSENISQTREQTVRQGPNLQLKRSSQVPQASDSSASSGPADYPRYNSSSLHGMCSSSRSRSSRQSTSSCDSGPTASSFLATSRRALSSSSCCTSDDAASRISSHDSSNLVVETDCNESSDSEGQLLTEQDEAVAAALRRIARFMDFRERCAFEVLAKLIELGYDRQCAVKVLKRLQQTGLQDDARFAEMYARGQWLSRTLAPAKIAHELRVRRVPPQHIDAALVAVFGDSKQVTTGDCADTQQEAAWEQLVDVCRQRVEGTQMYPQHKRRAKLATWLQRRGHSLSTAFRMFEELGM